MSAKKPPPPWLDLSRPLSDRPGIQRCPACQAPVLCALVGHVLGRNVRADPKHLDPAAELAARLQGRFTYCLRIHPHLTPRLLVRGPEHIRAGRCRHIVVADHQCTAPPAPPRTIRHPEPADDRLF